MSNQRASGLLLHITSLPGRYGIGDLGPEAYRFADFLRASGQSVWQMLPLVPTGYGYSPYAAPSTYAGNALLISPDILVEEGLLLPEDVVTAPKYPSKKVLFSDVSAYKYDLLEKAWQTHKTQKSSERHEAFAAYCRRQEFWLADYALFKAIKNQHDELEWMTWSSGLRNRNQQSLDAFKNEHADAIDMIKFWQFLFEKQWRNLRSYCNDRSIKIWGDLPIYVAQDSADVWANRHLFPLDSDGYPETIAGVPPDYFSETGQRWGNPLYKWDSMKKSGYAWWISRMSRILELVDMVRLDHFRGFEAYWEVPASEETAINGVWRQGPGADLFVALENKLGQIPIIAENLGVITSGVTDLMEQFGFPGMAILQFAFDTDETNEFLPHNYPESIVAYTGTHDNDTFMGWWTNTESTQGEDEIARAKAYCAQYLDFDPNHPEELPWMGLKSLMKSSARFVVTPVQDLLGLDAGARMNTPGTTYDNWNWRLEAGLLTDELAERLAALTTSTHR